MIEFNCACKQYKFSLPPEMAGSLIQCPTCRRLVDVPTLDELAHIHEDGGYKFEGESKSKVLDPRVAIRAFSRQRLDEFGQEIDLRTTMEQVYRAGVQHAPGTLDGVRPIPPKYDPVTGELIRALAIKNETPQRVLPVEPESDEPLDAVPIPPRKISYSAFAPPRISFASIFIKLFQPANVVVMGFILLMHLFAVATAFIVVNGFIFAIIAPLLLFMGLVGHFGNVIDEVGPGGRDELPAPMRDASFGDDIWRPFIQVSVAHLFAFLPLYLCGHAAMPPGVRLFAGTICLGAGVFILPALLLTSCTSGVYLNLRPDRVLGVIGVCGARYVPTVITFAAAGLTYWLSLTAIGDASMRLMQMQGMSTAFTELGVGVAILVGGIYLMHAFCWELGLLYRSFHEQFPWILQRHIPVRMAERTRPRPGHLPPVPGG
jgi:hypothetical protein